jgi:hypothetical protein
VVLMVLTAAAVMVADRSRGDARVPHSGGWL